MDDQTWPTRTRADQFRIGEHVINLAAYKADPEFAWEEICEWLAKCPPLVEIETFWMGDGCRRYLMISGMEDRTADGLVPVTS